jgi:hypothetical protein
MDRSRTLLILAAAGGLLALGAGAALPGSVSPTYNVAVDDTGPPEWEDLSPEAKTVVRTGLEAPGPVNVTFERSGSYGNGTTEFGPYPDDLPHPDIDQTGPSRMVIERDGTVLVFSAEFVGGGTLAVGATDRTDTARIQRETLSPHARTVLDVAAANGSAAFYTDRPPALEAGLDVTPDSLLVVVVSSPSSWVPLGPVLTPVVVFGSLAAVPAVALVGARRVGWPLATAAGVAVAVLPVVVFRLVAVGPSPLLGRRLQEMPHLVVLPAVGALLCVGVVWTWQTGSHRQPAADGDE